MGRFSEDMSRLTVMLDKPSSEISELSTIDKASLKTKGTTRIGIEAENAPTPESSLTATLGETVKNTKTAIPKYFSGKEILTAKQSAQINPLQNVPDILAQKIPVPENPDDNEKPFAQAPSVKTTAATSVPPAEKLVSSDPVPGKKQEKIVYVGGSPENPLVEKQPSSQDSPKPVKVEPSESAKTEVVQPNKIEEKNPVEISKPGSEAIAISKSLNASEPKHVKIADPSPLKAEEPHIENLKSEKNEFTSESSGRTNEAGKSDAFRSETPALKIPSLAELSFASVRKFASDEGKKIKFGDRKKTVSVREQDIRYAMYVESVRLKLERIGKFNFPAAAARNNLSGSLVVVITLRADGNLEEFSVIQPSVYEVLNAGAEHIVKMSAPFSPFPDSIRQDTDLLSIKINWTFSTMSQSLD